MNPKKILLPISRIAFSCSLLYVLIKPFAAYSIDSFNGELLVVDEDVENATPEPSIPASLKFFSLGSFASWGLSSRYLPYDARELISEYLPPDSLISEGKLCRFSELATPRCSALIDKLTEEAHYDILEQILKSARQSFKQGGALINYKHYLATLFAASAFLNATYNATYSAAYDAAYKTAQGTGETSASAAAFHAANRAVRRAAIYPMWNSVHDTAGRIARKVGVYAAWNISEQVAWRFADTVSQSAQGATRQPVLDPTPLQAAIFAAEVAERRILTSLLKQAVQTWQLSYNAAFDRLKVTSLPQVPYLAIWDEDLMPCRLKGILLREVEYAEGLFRSVDAVEERQVTAG